jgi:hypothetical protein
MSSLSTLPKGDSAWLLRKAIERIIQQISVQETNISSIMALPVILTGVVDPEGVVTAQPGSIYFNIAIAASPVQFVKGSGTGNTGWV